MDTTVSGCRLLDVHDLLDLGFPRHVAYSIFNREDFPAIRIGKRLFVRESSLAAWLASQERGASDTEE